MFEAFEHTAFRLEVRDRYSVSSRIRTETASGKPATLREFLIGQDSAWLADELLRVADADPLVAAPAQGGSGR